MAASADWYILINVVAGSVECVAEELKAMGFDNVRMTNGLNRPIDIIVFFNSSNIKITVLHLQLQSIAGITHADIIPAILA